MREAREWQKHPLEGIFFLNKKCLTLSALLLRQWPEPKTGLPRNPDGGIAAASPDT
jgi:hypothetical protein